MRFWSSFALFIAVLAPFSSVKANSGAVPLISIDSNTLVDAEHTELLNGTLSALVHADVDLGMDDHLALATADVEVDDLIAAVAVVIGADDAHDALTAAVSLEDVIDALIILSTEEGDGAALVALGDLKLDLDGEASGTIELGELFDVSDLELVDGLEVDLIDVIVNAASLWDQSHVIEPTTVAFDGDALGLDASIASAKVEIEVATPPYLQVGPDMVSAGVGHVEVLVSAELADAELELDTETLPLIGAKLVLGRIDLCLFAPWIEAHADVLDEDAAVMVGATVSRIHMCIGKPKRGAIGEGDDELTLEREVMPSVIGEIVVWIGGHEVPIARVTARSVASVRAGAEAEVFRDDFPATFPMDLGPSRVELVDELLANVEINVELLGSSVLSPIQLDVLQHAALDAFVGDASLTDLLGGDLLDGLLIPTVEILGSGVTSIDLKLSDAAGDDGDDDDHGSGGHDGDDDGDGVDVDVDSEVDVDVTVDEEGVSVDTEAEVGVDVDPASDEHAVDADVDSDIDVGADDDGVVGSVDPNIHLDTDADDSEMGSGSGNAANTLSLAGGGCSVGTGSNGAAGGWLSLVLLGLVMARRARRVATRS